MKLTLSEIGEKAKEIGINRKMWEGFVPEDLPIFGGTDVQKGQIATGVLMTNIMHVSSELTELYKAIHRERSVENTREEAVDIVMSLMGCLHMMGIELEDEDFLKVFAKNDKRVEALKQSH